MRRSPLLSAAAFAIAAIVAGCGGSDSSSEPTATPSSSKSSGAASLKGAVTETAAAKVDRRLSGARGPVQVWVSFDQDSLAQHRAKLAAAGDERPRAMAAKAGGAAASAESAKVREAMSVQRSAIKAQHAEASSRLAGLGATELARVSVAHNAMAVRVDAAQLQSIAALPGVVAVRPVVNHELHLAETVPYVGGAALQAAGFDGTGVRVAVLDSGADYTHRNLGGPGTTADYDACYAQKDVAPTGACAALFGPGAPKVIGGFDFVGEKWPGTAAAPAAEAPDPNPIDFEGHGTHVADIIAGRSADGTHKGMAPNAKILAVKVCSAVATSCSGIALLQGVDFALDPNGDNDLSDAVDVINLSLGTDYGQIEDDLSLALTNAVNAGVVVVASAGNGGDRPYKVGSPSTAPGVISVAQTQVPSAVAYSLVVTGITPSAINNTATVDWAPIGSGFSGPVVRVGRGCPALSIDGVNPDDPYFNGNSPSGKVALIDRGSCSVSLKIDRAKKAGAIAVIIANNAAGDPPSFSFGGGDLPLVPTVIITQSDGTRIKTALGATGVNPAVVASVSGSATIPLVGSMASTSSRGPSSFQSALKPEIGAPGASLSAEVGTGNGQTAFGGTSGAAPMVSGAAALLVQAFPSRSPMQIKAMLMNSAETAIFTNPATRPGELAPVSRIGAGELRVQRAAALGSIAWNTESRSAALAFGALEVAGPTVVQRKLRIENFDRSTKRFRIDSSFRFANDQATGAVKVQAPSSVTVPGRGSVEIPVTLVIDASKLPEWTFEAGPQGGDGTALTGPEYDGYVQLTAGSERLSVPWHVLPRKAALAFGVPVRDRSGRSVLLSNVGAEVGAYDLFSLMGTSPQLPRSALPQPGDNFAVVDLKAFGARYDAGCDCLQFAISTYGRRPHPLYPRGIEVDVDTGAGGLYFIFQDELGGFGGSGQSVVYVQKAGATTRSAFFFNDVDLNSGNTIYTVPMSALGLATPAGRSTTLTIDVYAYDNYFTGNLTDSITGMKFTPAAPRFSAVDNIGTVPRFAVSKVPYTLDGAVTAAQSSESGLLMMYRRNAGFEDQAMPIDR